MVYSELGHFSQVPPSIPNRLYKMNAGVTGNDVDCLSPANRISIRNIFRLEKPLSTSDRLSNDLLIFSMAYCSTKTSSVLSRFVFFSGEGGFLYASNQ